MGVDVFEYGDYREYLQAFLSELPNEGYGQLAKIARAISLNPSTITLVLQGQKDFTSEQAYDLCEHFEMTELESDYFMNLVAFSRAGKPNLRARLKKKLQKLKSQSKELKNRIPPKAELTNETKAIFYSQWYFSGARLLTSIDGYQSAEKIAEHLRVPRSTIKRVLEFLVSTGLCIEKNGAFQMGPQSTHLGTDSPLLSRHHQNWRFKAMEKADRVSNEDLFFTSPVSVSKAALPHVKKILVHAIEDCLRSSILRNVKNSLA